MTSSIARMNCFLHGIEDFRIERGDTLAEPKLVQGDHLMHFDVVLANPPYSIKQWDRDAFASDPWGRNLYGTPPQGRADYAFWQHILQSLSPKTGRCAILFPHGVLFRQEEADMRRKLIEADVIECVLGLGPNLFYNSPMEACVVICRTAKAKERRNKILFINAVNEVARERAQSFLTDDHIGRIVQAYEAFNDEPGFTRVVGLEEIRKSDFSINIPLYVTNTEHRRTAIRTNDSSLDGAFSVWLTGAGDLREALSGILGKGTSADLLSNARNMVLNDPLWLDCSKWQTFRFGQIAENIRESVMPTPADSSTYIGLEHMDTGSLHVRRWGSEADLIGQKLWMRKGDILFARRNAYLRRVAIAPHDGLFSAHGMILRAKPDVVLPEFLPFLMMSDRFMNRAVEISVGSLSPTINWTTLKLEEFVLPPLDQQRCIAAILWAVDDCVTRAQILAASFEGLRTAQISEAMGTSRNGGRLKDSPLGKIPEGWETPTLQEVCHAITDGVHKTPKYVEKGIPFVTVKNLTNGPGISFQDLNFVSESDHAEFIKRAHPEKGDVLLSKDGATLGVPRVIETDRPFSIFVSVALLKPDRAKLEPFYLYYALEAPVLGGRLIRNQAGSAIRHIHLVDLRGARMPLPPLSEQRVLVERIRESEQTLASVRQQLANAHQMAAAIREAILNHD